MIGAINQHLDGVQILVATFFVFFAWLIYYLRQEDKREGYPMEDVTPVNRPIEGFPAVPPAKVYNLLKGGTTQMPHHYGSSAVKAQRLLRFPGAPLVPVGNPLLAEVGPGAYPLREDEPLLAHGHPQVVPLRVATDWSVTKGDADPRGMPVHDSRHTLVGTVTDLWVDRAVKILRYLEVEHAPSGGALPSTALPSTTRRVLLPIYYADVSKRRRRVRVRALLAHQFADVPPLAHPDQITAREEDRVNAYYSGALMFSRGMDGGLPLPTTAVGAVP